VTIGQRFSDLRRRVDDELEARGRPRGSVTIVGISKKQPVEAVTQALDAGLADIGENYLQEARRKFLLLPPVPVRKHFVGHVQSNKAPQIAALFDLVQSVDRPEAAQALGAGAARAGKRLGVLLQLNISPSERFGCSPGDAARLASIIEGEPSLCLEGVMAIGPLGADQGAREQAFALAAKTFARVGGSILSIGMSGDWREAIGAGSTMVRIGTALFGERK
jgi:pyridoxal phosphate enzyme (YggS family)